MFSMCVLYDGNKHFNPGVTLLHLVRVIDPDKIMA